MAMPSGQRRQEFSFPGGSPARGVAEHALPPRPRGNPLAPRAGEEDSRWLQASRLSSPDSGSGGSGTPSPQLWTHHQHRLYPASAGSSPSRAQAIAGYRREMLDLVRGLPESAYELSLRDIVESPSPPQPPPPPQRINASVQEQEEDEPKKDVAAATVDEEAKKQSGGGGGGAKKQGKSKARKQRTTGRTRSRSLERSASLDTGLLIKLFLPLSVGGKKKVSPKPAAANDGKKKKKQGKKEKEEWWKKSEFSEAGSSSRTSSTSSSNSSTSRNGNGNGNGCTDAQAPTRSRSRQRVGCYGFFRANKSKNGVNQE